MAISEVKDQVASLLAERRSGSIATSSSSAISPVIKTAVVGGLIGMAGFLILPKLLGPKVTPAVSQGSPQMDQAMQMLQQQQDINRELLRGQQELNAQMIQAQSKAKTVQPNVNCFLAVCPGLGAQEPPNDQYAVVGQGIQTAVVNPTQMLPQLQQPAPYYQQPAQTIGYSPELESQIVGCSAEGWQSAHCAAVRQAAEGGL